MGVMMKSERCESDLRSERIRKLFKYDFSKSVKLELHGVVQLMLVNAFVRIT